MPAAVDLNHEPTHGHQEVDHVLAEDHLTADDKPGLSTEGLPTAQPRSAKHGAPPRVAFSSGSATVTLAVHPLHGQELTVRGAFGRYALWVETPNGQLRIMPLGWTNLGAPRLVQKHRLRAEDLLSLAAWVQDRKVDHFDKWVEGSDPDGRSRRSGRGAPAAKLPVAGDGDRHRGATAVVEQAGSSGPHVRTRRSAERKRGTR